MELISVIYKIVDGHFVDWIFQNSPNADLT